MPSRPVVGRPARVVAGAEDELLVLGADAELGRPACSPRAKSGGQVVELERAVVHRASAMHLRHPAVE